MARAGGPEALEAIVARLQDDDEAVRDEAVRMLSSWSDPAVLPHLLSIAEKRGGLRHQVLAIRGLVRLAGPHEDKPADINILAEAMNLAKRPQEKRLVLGVLGGIATTASLALVTPALDDPTLTLEASLAAVMIAEKIKDRNKDEIRAAIETVLEAAKSQPVHKRAEKILKSL